MSSKLWSEMVTTDFAGLDPEKTIALFPVGSTEQHGPHLPLMVDACIVEGVVARIRDLLPSNFTVLVLPIMPVGKSNEHMAFPGTLTLSAETLLRLWTEIAESANRTGIKKLMILNGHGGQTQIAEIVARDLRVRHKMLAVAVNWWSVRPKPSIFSEEEYNSGIHGGAEETSVMLHLQPTHVRKERFRNFKPLSQKLSGRYPLLLGDVPRFGWQAQDLEPNGVCGDATNANPQSGQKIIDEAAQSLVCLLEEMADFPLSELK